jgi:hypothetical protein
MVVKPERQEQIVSPGLVELERTNDAVRLSWLVALLAAEGIEAFILDTNTSVVEGGIGAIPRRLMVGTDDGPRALRLLADAGEMADE